LEGWGGSGADSRASPSLALRFGPTQLANGPSIVVCQAFERSEGPNPEAPATGRRSNPTRHRLLRRLAHQLKTPSRSANSVPARRCRSGFGPAQLANGPSIVDIAALAHCRPVAVAPGSVAHGAHEHQCRTLRAARPALNTDFRDFSTFPQFYPQILWKSC